MQRRWAVRPDPDTGMANRDEILAAIMDGEALLWRAGGVLTIVVARAPTDLDGEMVTTQAVLEWKDRTDGHLKPAPERAGDILPPEPPEPARVEPDAPVDREITGGDAAAADDIGDGLDPETLEEEDVSALPEAVR